MFRFNSNEIEKIVDENIEYVIETIEVCPDCKQKLPEPRYKKTAIVGKIIDAIMEKSTIKDPQYIRDLHGFLSNTEREVGFHGRTEDDIKFTFVLKLLEVLPNNLAKTDIGLSIRYTGMDYLKRTKKQAKGKN